MKIPVILGPTCIGKTSLAIEIAKQTNSDILSIDSRQVFKDLDIGTGKYKGDAEVIKKEGYWEISGIRIWGYDFIHPSEELNVLKYCEFAKKVIEDYKKNGKKILGTCGTGFYLDFLSGRIPFNNIDEVRKKELHKKSLLELLKIAQDLGIDLKFDIQNKLRVITKILSNEVSDNTQHIFKVDGVEFLIFELKDTRKNLYKNADIFVEEILIKGLVEEYKNNYSKYGSCRSLDGLIYKQVGEYLEGKILFDEMKSQIKFSLHAYIRRQETYFKKMQIYYSNFNRQEVAYKIKEIL
jgi:tRNA dimethylallyltransferase